MNNPETKHKPEDGPAPLDQAAPLNQAALENQPALGWITLPDVEARPSTGHRLRIRLGLIVSVLGFLIFVLGAEPGLLGLDQSQGTGFVQISVFLAGQGIICLGGFVSLNALWNGGTKSIIYDIGLRLVATGFVISLGSGMADVFGFGSHGLLTVTSFGAWKKAGVISGQFVVAVGFLMMIHYPRWMKILSLKGIQRMRNPSGREKATPR